MTMALPTIDELKSQAKRLRLAMAERGTPVAHSGALELVAQSHGARDWNTLSALAARAISSSAAPVRVEDKVRGRYLNQPFEGRVVSLAKLPTKGLYRVAIHFDRPVDVVTFESFSGFRQRVTAVIDENGISPSRTSNGVPHMVLEG